MGLFSTKKSRSTSVTNNTLTDSRSVNTTSDSNNRTTVRNADPAAVVKANTDAIRAIAGLGTAAFRDVGLTTQGAIKESAKSWANTVDASEKLLGQVLESSKSSTDAARAIAGAAIASFEPSENKAGDALKWAGIAAAVVAGLALLRRA
jgi:hypothetical protein